jgi:uncharacterized protein
MFTHIAALAGWFTGGLGFILGPLIMWLVKKDQSPFVDRHGKAAVNFQLSILVYSLAATVFFVVITILTLGIGALLMIPLLILGVLAVLVLEILFPILAGLAANQGKEYRYPLALALLK